MIERRHDLQRVESLLTRSPVVGLLGARQVGKTTLARQIATRASRPVTHFDLEDLDDLSRLSEPKIALSRLKGLVVLDEVQRRPDLFAVLRVLVDRPRSGARFLVLGSASPELLRQSSETLAGRIAFHELGGFSQADVGLASSSSLWLRGGFPRSFLAESDAASLEWRSDFIRTFLERDLPQLGSQIPSLTLHRFWRMLAHMHAQVWNAAELARAFGVAATTVRRYLDLLSGALVVRQLQPWHENLSKRQVRSPKVFIADTGLLHALLGVRSLEELEGHPKVGASWEGFVIREAMQALQARADECFFWATHAGAELDLLVVRGRHRLGIEVKRTTAPTSTKSMHTAKESLRLDRLALVHAGQHSFELPHGVEAVAFADLREWASSAFARRNGATG